MSTTRILIVEDDDLTALYLKKVLMKTAGYQVTDVVASGELAVQTAAANPPEVVLMDIMLTGELDGIAAAAQIRTRQHIPIIYLTAYVDADLLDRIKATEPFGYLLKPFQEAELRIAIETARYKHKLETEVKETNHRLEQEIAERKRAEEAIRASEELHRITMENMMDPIFITDDEGIFTFICANVSHILGYSVEELQVMGNIRRLIGDGLFTLAELAARGKIRNLERMIVAKDGGEHIFLITMKRVAINGGTVLYVWRDITERKQAEAELQASREQLRKLAVRLSAAEEAERQRIARELHDCVGQNLTALSINLSIFQDQLPSEVTSRIRERLNDSQNLLEETTEVIRNVMTELRPSVLDDYGLLAALHWYGDLFARRTNIPVTVRGVEFAPRLPMFKETALFRIVQEALTNIAKYANAAQVTISLDREAEKMILAIVDDGCGFDPATPHPSGWGLIAMRERALAVGGRLDIISAPGQGTKIIVELERP